MALTEKQEAQRLARNQRRRDRRALAKAIDSYVPPPKAKRPRTERRKLERKEAKSNRTRIVADHNLGFEILQRGLNAHETGVFLLTIMVETAKDPDVVAQATAARDRLKVDASPEALRQAGDVIRLYRAAA